MVAYCAHKKKAPLLRIVMSSGMTVESFLGTTKVTLEDDRPTFTFSLGGFAEAFRDGYWTFLDEFNLGLPPPHQR